jgi:hypothetical protein
LDTNSHCQGSGESERVTSPTFYASQEAIKMSRVKMKPNMTTIKQRKKYVMQMMEAHADTSMPERKLWLAVLHQAVKDIKSIYPQKWLFHPNDFWHSDECTTICHLIDLDPKMIRGWLLEVNLLKT